MHVVPVNHLRGLSPLRKSAVRLTDRTRRQDLSSTVYETHTVHARCIHKNLVTTLERQGKQKVTGGLGGGGLGEQSGGLGAWCRGRWLGGLNYFAAKKGLIAMHQYKLEM